MPSAKLGNVDPNRTGLDELTDEQFNEIADVACQTTPRATGCLATLTLLLLAGTLVILILTL